MNRPSIGNRLCQSLVLLLLVVSGASGAEPRHHRIRAIVTRIDEAVPGLKRQDRLLLGASTAASSVEAYRSDGALRKIVVATLMPTGYTIDAFYFDNGRLIRLRHLRYLYPDHPRMTTTPGAPPTHMVVSGANKRLASDLLDFEGGRLLDWIDRGKARPVTGAEAETWRTKALIEAHNYVTLMNTPLPAGGTEGAVWSCATSEQDACALYRPQ